MKMPRVLFAAPSSGSGKTTITCAVLQALCNRSLSPAAFKCGPDYIDPMFHREIIGAKSGNLDLFLCGRDTVRRLFLQNAKGAGIAVVEGVMGYYDGIGLGSRAGGYELADALDAPVILIVDARGAGLSLLAQIQGFLQFRPQSRIQGVVFNRLSPSLYPGLKELLEKELGILALGYFPSMPDCTLQSRHLGLITAGEVADLKARMDRLAAQAEKTVDLDLLLKLARGAPELEPPGEWILPGINAVHPRIAVAKDRAFCFYYEDALELLERLGAELVPFRPLEDISLPQGCSGLLLGGGYPELYADVLEDNILMRKNVRQALAEGLPCVAECGGFLYLHDTLEDEDGTVRKMAGVVSAHASRTKRLQHFGYAMLKAQRDNLLCRTGEQIPAHEFHYWQSTDNGDAFLAEKPGGKKSWPGVHGGPALFAGFPHFHFCSDIRIAAAFVSACADYEKKRRKL